MAYTMPAVRGYGPNAPIVDQGTWERERAAYAKAQDKINHASREAMCANLQSALATASVEVKYVNSSIKSKSIYSKEAIQAFKQGRARDRSACE